MTDQIANILQGALGLGVLVGLAWLLSEDRRSIPPRLVLAGLGAQLLLALLLLKLPPIKHLFLALNDLVLALQEATRAGTGFVFGYLGGGDAPFESAYPQNAFILAFQALPLLLVISALSALLFHLRLLPLVVKGFAWALRKTLGVGGALGLGAAANIFVGMTEAPLLIRPYLEDMSRGSLFGLMACGMATIAGTVMMLYASILGPAVEDALGHILTVLNELLAYLKLTGLPEGALSERSRVIMTYALCGFANFGSLGIMIGGLGAMAPERRSEIVALGMKSILAGTLATLSTGAVVGMLI